MLNETFSEIFKHRVNSVIIIFWKDYQDKFWKISKDTFLTFFQGSFYITTHQNYKMFFLLFFCLFLGIWIFSTEFLFSLKTIEFRQFLLVKHWLDFLFLKVVFTQVYKKFWWWINPNKRRGGGSAEKSRYNTYCFESWHVKHNNA